MASPLIFRVVMQVEDSQLKSGTQNLRAFKDEALKANIELKGSEKQIKDLIKYLDDFGKHANDSQKHAHGAFGITHQELRGLSSDFLIFRRLLGLAGLIGLPFILAGREILKTDEEIKKLNTSLVGLGATVGSQTGHFKDFVYNLTFGTSTSISEGIEAINKYIEKSRGLADVEKVVSAAQVLHIASGAKLVDVTSAISDALNGNSEALSKLTGRTKEDITNLARSGELTKKIEQDYAIAAQQAQTGAYEGFKTTYTTAIKSIGQFLDFITFSTFRQSQEYFSSLLSSAKNIKSAFQDLNETSINFNSIDTIKNKLQRTDAVILDIKGLLSSGFLPDSEVDKYKKILPSLEEQRKLLQQIVKSENELAGPERFRLQTETQLVQKQNEALISRKDLTKDILDLQIRQIQAETLAAKRKLVESSPTGIVPTEQLDKLDAEAQQKILKRRQENEIRELKDLEATEKSKTNLQQFYLVNRLRRFENISVEEGQKQENILTNQKLDLALDEARKEREIAISEGRFTDAEKLRQEQDLELKLQQIRKEAEDSRAKEAESRLKNLTDAEQKQVQELVAKLVDTEKHGGDFRATIAFRELESFKKINDSRQKDAKDTQDIITRIFGEPVERRAGLGEGRLQTFRSEQEKRNLSTTPLISLTPTEEVKKVLFDSFRDDATKAFKDNPIKADVALNVSKNSVDEFAKQVVKAIQDNFNKNNPILGAATNLIIKGVEQGGSD